MCHAGQEYTAENKTSHLNNRMEQSEQSSALTYIPGLRTGGKIVRGIHYKQQTELFRMVLL